MKKRISSKPLLIAALFIVFCYHLSYGYSTNNTTLTRSLVKNADNSIQVTVTFKNKDHYVFKGFYYSEFIPQGINIRTDSVAINGKPISDYLFEFGNLNDVYPNRIAYRWILESPPNFNETNPISPGSALEIIYTMSTNSNATVILDEFNWVTYYFNTKNEGNAGFGYSEKEDKIIADFSAPPPSQTPPAQPNETKDTSTSSTPPQSDQNIAEQIDTIINQDPPDDSENVTTKNNLPVADAGADQIINESTDRVVLNAENSFDEDDGITAFKWKQISGSPVTLSGKNTAKASFTPPKVGYDGETLTFEITVTDESGATAKDTCIVNIVNENAPPLADAGKDQNVKEQTRVTLDGTHSSDMDDSISAYRWTQLKGTPVTLSRATTAKASFMSPAVGKDGEALVFQLTVTDAGGLKAKDTCIVNILWQNGPPQSDAGIDQEARPGDVITLDGNESYDPDDDIVQYHWQQIEGTNITLRDPTSAETVFTAPQIQSDGEVLIFELTVTDSGKLKSTDQCEVFVNHIEGSAPIAHAGQDQVVKEGEKVVLNGSLSSDTDEDILFYYWKQSAGPSIDLENPYGMTATFIAPEVDKTAKAVFELTVFDSYWQWHSDMCNVIIKPKTTIIDATPPELSITAPTSRNIYMTFRSTITLAGIASDDTKLSKITWSTSSGKSGSAIFSNDSWFISNIQLKSLITTITVTAKDSAGNETSQNIHVIWLSEW